LNNIETIKPYRARKGGERKSPSPHLSCAAAARMETPKKI